MVRKIKIGCIGIVVLFISIFVVPSKAYAASNPYSGGYANCTWSAWQLAYEDTGHALPSWGNAANWDNAAANAGYTVTATPREKSIAVWEDSGYGHVGYVTAVNGNQIYVKEGNYSGAYHEGWLPSSGYRNNTQRLVGYIYIPINWYDSMTPTDIGTDFYASIIKYADWVHLGNVNGNVEITGPVATKDARDVWYFARQNDGSYVIYNCLDNKVLTVSGSGQANGTNVIVSSYAGTSNQRWYIYGRWSGEFVLRPQYTEKVIDIYNGNSSIGTNVHIWPYSSNNAAQQLVIYKWDKVGNSQISTVVGDSATDTKFSWTAAKGATGYNLRIKKGSSGNMKTYKDIRDVTETNYNLVLPEGYYEVYVDSYNRYSFQKSNTISFTVKKSDMPIINSIEKKCNEDGSYTISWDVSGVNSSYKVQLLAVGEDNRKVVYDITESGKGTYTIPISVFESLGKPHAWGYIAQIRISDLSGNMLKSDEEYGIAPFEKEITVAVNSEAIINLPNNANPLFYKAYYDESIISVSEIPETKSPSDIRIKGLKKGFTNVFWRSNKNGEILVNIGVKVVDHLPLTKVSKISLNGLSKKIAAGKKVRLTANVSPSNASNKAVTWKSSNKKVATVNTSGVVTMKKKSGGKSVIITATAQDGSGVKATYKIKSMKGVVKKVSISGKKNVKAGKTLKLKGKVKATKSANKKLKWTSSNTKYAKVTNSGKIKTYKAGKGKKVKITAMATDGSGKKKSVTIKIK